MKFLRLEIRNINSIESAYLNFEDDLLKNEPIFLSHGETGSGKSTILDSICLALYKTTPRLEGVQKIKLNDETYRKNARGSEAKPAELTTQDPRQYMRRGIKQSDPSYVELLFEGNDGNPYTARIEFGIGRQMSLSETQWTLRMPNGEIMSRDADIKPIITAQVGLDFQQFCRTTLLAQGEFTKFLKAENKDKAAILEKITQTDIYTTIGKRITERANAEKQTLDALQKEVETRSEGLMTDEQIIENEKLTGKLIAQNHTLDGLAQIWSEQSKWLQSLATLQSQFASKNEEYERQKQRRNNPEFQKCETLIQQWHQAESERHAFIETVNIKRQITANETALTGMTSKAAQLLYSTQLMRHEKELTQTEITKKETEERNHRTKLDELNNAIIKINLDSLTQSQARLNSRKADAQTLLQRRNELNGKKHDAEQTQRALKTCKELVEKLTATLNEQQANSEVTEKELKRAQDECDKISLAIGDYAKALRSRLTEGDVCPVCGQIVGKLQHDEALENAIKPYLVTVEKLKTRLEQEKKSIEITSRDIAKHNATISVNTNNLETINKFIGTLTEQQQDLLTRLHADANEDVEDIINEAAKQLAEIQPQIDNYQQLVRQWEATNKMLTSIGTELSNLRNSMTNLLHHISTAESVLKQLPKDWQYIEPKQSAIEKSQFELQWQQLGTDYATYTSTEANLRTRLDYQNHILSSSRFDHEQIRIIASLTPEYVNRIETEQKKINDDITRYEGELANINKQLEQHRRIRPIMAEGDTAERIEQRLREIERTKQANNVSIGQLRQTLTAHRNTAGIVSETKHRTEKQRLVYEEWKELSNIFGGSAENPKFRAIAQSFVMRELLNHANKYMEAFMPRYQLECRDNNLVVQVRDRYCDGQLRNFATASGGESFVVSLALALGLMSLGGNAINVDTLFIDEGFGSLDAQTLETVIESLSTLHDICHRRVGIISHVESLKERIPARISLVRNKSTNTITALKIE